MDQTYTFRLLDPAENRVTPDSAERENGPRKPVRRIILNIYDIQKSLRIKVHRHKGTPQRVNQETISPSLFAEGPELLRSPL